VIYCPLIGFVGTSIEDIMTSDSDGAFGSPTGRWNMRGAGFSNRMFPAGVAFTVSVLTSILAGVPKMSWLHHGVTALIYAPVGIKLIYSGATNYVPIICEG
jgi:hypothetical protein